MVLGNPVPYSSYLPIAFSHKQLTKSNTTPLYATCFGRPRPSSDVKVHNLKHEGIYF
jgi:hypothetical protein